MTNDPSESNPTCSGIPHFKRVCGVFILLNCAGGKGFIFGVDFGRLISCLPTDLIRIWILPKSSIFCLAKSVFVTLS